MAVRKLSTSELRRELARREAAIPKLSAEHRTLSARLREVEAELAALGGAAPARRGRKPGRPKSAARKSGRPKRRKAAKRGARRTLAKNPLSLAAAILKQVRPGSKVTPSSVTTSLKASGFKSTSKTFGVMVSNALAKLPEFKRLGRGEYLRKGGAAAKAAPARGKAAKSGKSAPAAAAAS